MPEPVPSISNKRRAGFWSVVPFLSGILGGLALTLFLLFLNTSSSRLVAGAILVDPHLVSSSQDHLAKWRLSVSGEGIYGSEHDTDDLLRVYETVYDQVARARSVSPVEVQSIKKNFLHQVLGLNVDVEITPQRPARHQPISINMHSRLEFARDFFRVEFVDTSSGDVWVYFQQEGIEDGVRRLLER